LKQSIPDVYYEFIKNLFTKIGDEEKDEAEEIVKSEDNEESDPEQKEEPIVMTRDEAHKFSEKYKKYVISFF